VGVATRTNQDNRRIHLVDIENVCGDARPGQSDVRAMQKRYEDLVNPGPDDLVVVACNHGAALEVGLGWPGARLLVRSGINGADQALLGVIEHEGIELRFAGVVIASADGIFTEAASFLAGCGLSVTVVSRERALSRRLRLAVACVCTFTAAEFDQDAA
jgi:hypothetical protein